MYSDTRPNIIWILIDSLRPDLLNKFVKKNKDNIISRLISSGTSFTTCITTAPYTIASAGGALLTSFFPKANKVDAWFKCIPSSLDRNIITFAEILKKEGYYNVYLSPKNARCYVPPFGFDIYEMLSAQNCPLYCPPITSFTKYLDAPEPKFCISHFEAIHDLCCKDPTSFNHERYFNSLLEVSRGLQPFVDKILPLQNTIIVICSDHGIRTCEDITSDLHKDERVTGKYLTDKTLQTLFTIIYPKKIPGGKTIDRMVRTIDIAPTILDLLHFPMPTAQGVSLMPLINGDDKFPELKTFSLTGGMHTSPWKPDTWGLRTDEWKLVKTEKRYGIFKRKRTLTYQLYHIKNDPHEQIDCINDFPEIAEEFQTELNNYLEDDKSNVKYYYEKGNFPYHKYLKSRYYPWHIRRKVFFNTLFRYKLNSRIQTQIVIMMNRPIFIRIRKLLRKKKGTTV